MKNRITSVIVIFAMIISLFPSLLTVSVREAKAWTTYQENIVKRANYMYNAQWTCQKTVEGWSGTFYAGNTYRVPYGQPVYSGSYIGFQGGSTLDDSSIDTYLAAAADANSIFYSGRSHCGGTTAPYYATDCSAFVSWCWGISRKTTYTLQFEGSNLGLATASNCLNLQLGDALNSNTAGHVVLVTGLSYNASGVLTQIEITEQTPPQLKRSYYTPEQLGAKYGSEYYIMRWNDYVPMAPNSNELPEGSLDEVTGDAGSVKVRGWAFDKDDTSKNLEVHVYVGGRPGEATAQGRIVIADDLREDVDAIHGCGKNHGFDVKVGTSLTGEQPVYVYAIDSNDSSKNTLLGSKTVTITSDTEKPKASDLKVISSDYKSFTLSCNAEDNGAVSKAEFSVWTEDAPTEVKKYDGAIKDGVVTCTVPIADFEDYNGLYYADVKISDGAENSDEIKGFNASYNLPKSFLDEVSDEKGAIRVRGWAYDADDLKEALEIHVYIGGLPGEDGVEFNKIKADVLRTDVNEVYGCGEYHGFNAVIPTALKGEQTVYVYAINVGNGDNQLIKKSTVIITEDEVDPEIEDIKVISSDKNGYTISCNVSDNNMISKVKFPTWTEENPDNKIWYIGTVENGVATCTIPIADFENYEGQYITHVYAYDAYDNFGVQPFVTTFNLPKGSLELATDENNGIKVKGWAFDGDNPDDSIEVHIYIGGESGSENAELYKFTTDMLRDDINEKYGCKGNHGFEKTLPTMLMGEQPVYMYAINTGNGENVFIEKTTLKITPLLMGDADGNGEVNISDVTHIQKKLARIIDNVEEEILADVSGDGKLTIRDATYIQLFIANKLDNFPVYG